MNTKPHKCFKILKKLSISLLIICVAISVQAQTSASDIFGQGLTFGEKDSSFFTKFSARLQSRYDGIYIENSSPSHADRFFFRRARLKLDGFAFSPRLTYKIEYDVINSQMLDAVVKWNFAGNYSLWFGQAKLPGNRERIVSSQKLQFVDRSLLNSRFNIDRDQGIQIRHHFNLGGWHIRESFSVSKGEGRIYKGENFGNDYTAKLELLPFGEFSGKGDYFSSDLKREPVPKLALAIIYGYNNNAIKSRGQLGSVLSQTRDLETVFVDMMYKHNGVSILAEYANKKVANGTPVILDTSGNLIESFYTGTAVNAQLGYLFRNNWEVSGRFTQVNPQQVTLNNDLTQYTVGVSKYIVGHNLKVQSDFSLLQEDSKTDRLQFRLQLELAF